MPLLQVGRLMSDVGGEFRDGKLLCEFTHSQRFTIRGEDFDLASDDLYLMLASGTASGQWRCFVRGTNCQ